MNGSAGTEVLSQRQAASGVPGARDWEAEVLPLNKKYLKKDGRVAVKQP
ncbi:hypothetical protein HNQ92_001218 [Rhabdobacter roseus]|uniref:Uncharacterized protein n=1 Tax=Rhabdobacter roseus TaxID=1655419 RepID=A0A840TNG5_9BACT|nr:hypothetical protein [Rhabdobacter roseus]MBB5283092.1 hypothetical protein [Rhabdobacter roseus]